MSELERMAHRVVMGSFAGPTLPRWVLARLEAGLGSVALFGSNVTSADQVRSLTAAMRVAGPDVLVATDEEAGDVTRLHMATGSPWPGNAALGAVDDVRLTEVVAAGVGAELGSVGVDLDLAPVVDVNSNPDNPVIGVRSFGAVPELVARHTTAFVSGLQSAGVGACAKHFPGHGDTAVDSHLGLPTVDASLEVLRARELVPFAAAVASGAVAVMTSHVLLPAIDAELPATLSGRVLGVLRRELGFDGLVVTDALDMAGVSAGRGVPAAAVAALVAGCDLLCLGADKTEGDLDAVVTAVVHAVKAGELDEARLAAAAERVLAARRWVQGLRAVAPAGGSDGGSAAGGDLVAAGLAAGRQVAARSVEVAARPVQVAAGGSPDARLPDLGHATVLRFRTGSNAAVGQVPWGLPLEGSVQGGRHPLDVTRSDVEEVVPRAIAEADDAGGPGTPGKTGRPLVALVREAHRHPWVLAALRRLADACPDLVTVEMGWPGPQPLPGAVTVRTYGASRVNGAALDAFLASGTTLSAPADEGTTPAGGAT